MPNSLNELPSNRALVLNNVTCPYCGAALDDDNDTKEHVIGRRFVPKGTLHGCWNLIVRACERCNSEKSKLENDISAITLSGKLWFGSDNSEEKITKEANRKAKSSISKKTGRPVIQSHEELNFDVLSSLGVSLKLNMISPPQIERDRLYELARLQMMAFFYFVTFSKETKRGGFWPEGFHPLSETHHDDWGNALQKSFMAAVVKWEPRWIGNTADGYFRSIIRRAPKAECWSWAVEWNKNYRVIGFFGNKAVAQELVSGFYVPKMTTIKMDENSFVSFRRDVKLSEEEDLLFLWGN